MPVFFSSDAAAAPVDTIDPRARIVATVAFSVLVAIARRPILIAAAPVLMAAAAIVLRWRRRDLFRQLLPLNGFMAVLGVLLSLTAGGASLVHWGPLGVSQAGLRLAVVIALKGNAVALAVLVLLGTIDLGTLGHALRHLGVPEKLTHVFLFTVRYVDVLEREFGRLRAAMLLRGFRPRVNPYTYRAYGYLLGMLLVRSLDRSERIVAAMKCRGFRGRFYLLDHFAFTRRDARFAAVSVFVFLALALLEWLPR